MEKPGRHHPDRVTEVDTPGHTTRQHRTPAHGDVSVVYLLCAKMSDP